METQEKVLKEKQEKPQFVSRNFKQVTRDLLKGMTKEVGTIVEIGTGVGDSAMHWYDCKPDWNIFTIDSFGLTGDKEIYNDITDKRVKETFDRLQGKVVQILGNSSTVRFKMDIDLLFIDGGHSYEDCRADFDNFKDLVGGYAVFHDLWRTEYGVKRVFEEAIKEGWIEVMGGEFGIIKRHG